MEPCSACQKPARYRCPSCQLTSCSLACINVHKRVTGCNGAPTSATSYIALSEYDESAFHRDIAFLQQKIISAPTRRCTDDTMDPPFALWMSGRQHLAAFAKRYAEYIDLPYFSETERDVLRACLRRETFLCWGPPASTRRRHAPSYSAKTDTITWPVRIRLINSATGMLVDRMVHGVAETATVGAIMDASLPDPCAIMDARPGAALFLEDERVLLDADGFPQPRRPTVRISPSSYDAPLHSILARRFVLQYPVFTVIA